MGDLLTQLQDEVYMMSDLFGVSVGVLQRDAPALPLMDPVDPERMMKRDEFVKLSKEMAQNLIQRAKRVESLIERLPGVNRTEPEQYKFLEELEQENLLAGEKLVQTYEQAEELLNQVRQALRTISENSITKTPANNTTLAAAPP
eukprot:Phypoly_transcript_22130.p1 GENE.Phypoly_transcript_22130~~Phypoly_transcript_22130.p1  ORF type:complete len:159 (+),score=22.63 Phypoly_transcript_22130:45-479(+)